MASKHYMTNISNTGLRLVLTLVMCFFSLFFTRAQDTDTRVKVLFPHNSAVVSSNYLSNATALDSLDVMITDAAKSGSVINVETYSSPEGNYEYNRKLSVNRASAIKDYITSKDNSGKVNIKLFSGAESWDELRARVVSDNTLSEETRRQILDIIDSDNDPDVKENLFNGNKAHRRIYNKHFSALRYAIISLKIDKPENNASNGGNGILDNGVLIVYYSLNEDYIRPDHMNNAANLREIRRVLSNPANMDKSIVLEGTASPEGPDFINRSLGEDRAQNLADWLVGQFPDLEGRIVIRAKGEDWDGLRSMVENCGSLSAKDKEEILDIIDSDNTPEKKEELLKAHRAYGIVEKECFPYIRYARFAGFEIAGEETAPLENTLTIVRPQVDTTVAKPVQDTLSTQTPEPLPIEPEETKEARRGLNTVAALKTNLLFDAATALNAEVEFPIGNRYSIMVEDVFPWWEYGNKYCFQLWEMGVEARFWFKSWKNIGSDKLRGWFAGPYVMSGKYDFQFDKSINYQGEMWSAGLTGGYAMPIGKNKKARLEFSVSMGYMKSPYRHYLPTDDYLKLIHDPSNDGTFYNIFLYPTKAKVSLVLPINIPTWKEVRYE